MRIRKPQNLANNQLFWSGLEFVKAMLNLISFPQSIPEFVYRVIRGALYAFTFILGVILSIFITSIIIEKVVKRLSLKTNRFSVSLSLYSRSGTFTKARITIWTTLSNSPFLQPLFSLVSFSQRCLFAVLSECLKKIYAYQR